jgi:hypothetical protein
MTDHLTASQQLQELRERYPYMFPPSASGFMFYRGWLPMTVRICEEIDALLGDDKRGFCWTQIKEKFGSACFYYGFNSIAARETNEGTQEELTTAMKIARIVAAATDESLTTCQVCGAAAGRQSYAGFVVTLCGKHKAEGSDDAAWHEQVINARLEAPSAGADQWALREGGGS